MKLFLVLSVIMCFQVFDPIVLEAENNLRTAEEEFKSATVTLQQAKDSVKISELVLKGATIRRNSAKVYLRYVKGRTK